jgi:hypothetical protein
MQRSKMLLFFGIDRFGGFAGLTSGHRLMCSGFRAGGGTPESHSTAVKGKIIKSKLTALATAGCALTLSVGAAKADTIFDL